MQLFSPQLLQLDFSCAGQALILICAQAQHEAERHRLFTEYEARIRGKKVPELKTLLAAEPGHNEKSVRAMRRDDLIEKLLSCWKNGQQGSQPIEKFLNKKPRHE